jgi:hypothetical protein
MGFSHPKAGVYIFNEMDSAEAVERLASVFSDGYETGDFDLPYSLQEKMEGTLPPDAIGDIPWG